MVSHNDNHFERKKLEYVTVASKLDGARYGEVFVFGQFGKPKFKNSFFMAIKQITHKEVNDSLLEFWNNQIGKTYDEIQNIIEAVNIYA